MTTYMANPEDWTTWTDARWIWVNRDPNGHCIIWAQNFTALSNWLTRRCSVSATGLTATNVYTAIQELTTTRIADNLVSTDTAPSVNNTINWVYK